MRHILTVVLIGWAALGAPPGHAHEDLATLDLAAYRGQVVYLDFWASWCAPCRRSFPFMDQLQKRYADQGLVVIAVNVDTERALATQFLREVPVDLRIAYDPKGQLAAAWQVPGMPSSFLIGRDGVPRVQHAGFRSADREPLERAIQNLLAEHTP